MCERARAQSARTAPRRPAPHVNIVGSKGLHARRRAASAVAPSASPMRSSALRAALSAPVGSGGTTTPTALRPAPIEFS